MEIPQRCDVVVIGGGPAGSMASAYLSRNGYEVVLFDKQKHPRYQVGESILPDLWTYCDAAGVTEKIQAEGFVRKAGGMVHWKGVIRAHSFEGFGYSGPALHVERDRFDHILLQHASDQGTQVFEEVSVLGVDLERDDQTTVTYRPVGDQTAGRISCRFVVDASGQNSVIGKQLGLRVIDNAFRYMSVWGYFDDARYIDFEGNARPSQDVQTTPPTTFISSLAGSGDSGWSWHIMLRECTSVGLILPLEMMKSIKRPDESWEACFLRQCRQIPVTNRLLENARFREDGVRIIRDYSYRSQQVAGPGFFLIGDAAGFVDPIFSVGVALSMYSAYAAAWAIDRSLRNRALTASSQGIFAKQLQGRLEVARSLALPRYRSTGRQVSELAKEMIKLKSDSVQELMHIASSLTTRSQNFLDMMEARNPAEISPGKLRIVEDLNLD